MNIKNEMKDYLAPQAEILELETEQCFAESGNSSWLDMIFREEGWV